MHIEGSPTTGQGETAELEREMGFAVGLAKEAGSIIARKLGTNGATEWKEDNTPVTQTDKEVNALTIQKVQEFFPEDGVLGEEASYATDRDRLWVVDPIDGTQAFDLGAPVSTFSLALVENGHAKMGVVYDPFLNRMYTAIRGQGAFVNGDRMHVSAATSMAQQYAVLSSRSLEGYKKTGELYDAIVDLGGKPFSFRSVIYGYMKVATGDAAAAVAGSLKPWDYAAAKVILEEAGATITDFSGQMCEYDQVNNGIIVSNGHVHQELLNLVQK